MCGRYLIDDEADSAMCLGVLIGEVFPTNIAPVFNHSGMVAALWGFPHWKSSGVIINARAETASQKNMFRKPLISERCVVPSSGFYEWSRGSGRKKKDKYLLRLPEENFLFMAGMIDVFTDAHGTEYSAFVILTTSASASVAQIHDRMPVILSPEERDAWIGDSGFMEHVLHRPGPELAAQIIPS